MGCAISIVIPTYNRQARLARVLEALATQSVGPARFEVVVIDDGSVDGTAEWIRSQRYPFGLILLEQTNSGPAAARNAGVARAESLGFVSRR